MFHKLYMAGDKFCGLLGQNNKKSDEQWNNQETHKVEIWVPICEQSRDEAMDNRGNQKHAEKCN